MRGYDSDIDQAVQKITFSQKGKIQNIAVGWYILPVLIFSFHWIEGCVQL